MRYSAVHTTQQFEIHMLSAAMRILVADDYADVAETTATLLRLEGHEVLTAYDGATAVELAASLRPHVALLDIGLPRLDGYQVARAIRGLSLKPDPYLVAVTGLGTMADKRLAGEAGFSLHLVKPVEPEMYCELMALLDESHNEMHTSRTLRERNRELATDLIIQQIQMACIQLDAVAINGSPNQQHQYIAHAARVYDRVVAWLARGECANGRSTGVFSMTEALRSRLPL